MKLLRKYSLYVLMGLALAGSVALTSCNDNNDEFSTNQYTGGVKLNVWGPSPVARGGELRFLGSGMDHVTGITLPGSGKITDLKLINNEEVRITVPQDAEEGYVTVHTSEGDITTKTMLTFLEPISLESISPLTVKPGDVLTLSGEYLNNIHEIIFSEDKSNPDVTIPEDSFLTHSRSEISLVVPAEAKSGGLILSDGDEDMPNWIIAEDEITIVLPTVDEIIELESANPGDEITISGNDLDLVVAVVMANGEEIEFTYYGPENGTETKAVPTEGVIIFTIPDNACNGPICLVTASGVEIVAVNIGECQPEDLVATPATGLKAGETVTLTGKNLQMIASVVPAGSDAVEFTLESNEKITFVFPASAVSGDVVLTLKGGGEVSVALETAKPAVLTTEMLAAGSTATLSGQNLDLLVAITFADGSKTEVKDPAPDAAVVNIPVTAVSGVASLHMANGETSEWNANISAPTGAYIIEGPSDEDEVSAGEIVTFTIGNAETLSGVLINNEPVQYILNGSMLLVNLPNTCGKGTTVTLLSNDGSQLDYSYDFIPATHVGRNIWKGMTELGWSDDANRIYLTKDMFEGVPAGATMTLTLTPLSGIQIQFNNCNWTQMFIYEEWNNYEGMTSYSFELTQEILDELLNTNDGWSNNAMILQGSSCVISSIDIEWENALETQVPFEWSDVDMGNYSINLEGKPATAFIDAGVKVGSTLRLYCTPTVDYNPSDPQVHIQIFDGHWAMMSFSEINGGTQFNESTWGDMSKIEIKVTPEMYEQFTTLIDWGYCIIFQGNNIIINKVTIE